MLNISLQSKYKHFLNLSCSFGLSFFELIDYLRNFSVNEIKLNKYLEKREEKLNFYQ